MPDSVRIAVRVYGDGELVCNEKLCIPRADLEGALPIIALRHAAIAVRYELHMVELEFVDDPGEDRFFRMGTDPRAMVRPIRVALGRSQTC